MVEINDDFFFFNRETIFFEIQRVLKRATLVNEKKTNEGDPM